MFLFQIVKNVSVLVKQRTYVIAITDIFLGHLTNYCIYDEIYDVGHEKNDFFPFMKSTMTN